MILPEYLSQKNKKIIDRYGLPEQLLQLQEECAELIQAASKYRRKRNLSDKAEVALSAQNLRCEITDVLVLIDQIMERVGVTKESLELMAEYKIDRTIGRM